MSQKERIPEKEEMRLEVITSVIASASRTKKCIIKRIPFSYRRYKQIPLHYSQILGLKY